MRIASAVLVAASLVALAGCGKVESARPSATDAAERFLAEASRSAVDRALAAPAPYRLEILGNHLRMGMHPTSLDTAAPSRCYQEAWPSVSELAALGQFASFGGAQQGWRRVGPEVPVARCALARYAQARILWAYGTVLAQLGALEGARATLQTACSLGGHQACTALAELSELGRVESGEPLTWVPARPDAPMPAWVRAGGLELDGAPLAEGKAALEGVLAKERARVAKTAFRLSQPAPELHVLLRWEPGVPTERVDAFRATLAAVGVPWIEVGLGTSGDWLMRAGQAGSP